MAVFTYKCPNCDAGMVFRPEKKDFYCEYCYSAFTEEQLAALEPQAAQAEGEGVHHAQRQAQYEGPGQQEFEAHTTLFSCPSCGAEVMADDTTAAATCYYCHNPVVNAGRLSGAFKPDCVIPFAFDHTAAVEKFSAWCRKKWFIKKDFVREAKTDNLRGVYLPFWLVDGSADTRMVATGNTVRVWRTGKTEYTETSVYRLERAGAADFGGITINALNKEESRMVQGIYPFNLAQTEDFAMPYLSGFLAQKRNVEREEALSEADATIRQICETLLKDTIVGYSGVRVTSLNVDLTAERWRYALLPAWLMTYKYEGADYYFAMNGQTGQVAGRVPYSWGKLSALGGGIAAAAAALMILLRGWLA